MILQRISDKEEKPRHTMAERRNGPNVSSFTCFFLHL